MPWTGWPRIPVQPGRSRTDRQTCGGCGPAADLPADADPWHQCRAGISDRSFPRTTGTPSIGLGGVTADALGIQAVYLLGGILLLLAGTIGLAGLRSGNSSRPSS